MELAPRIWFNPAVRSRNFLVPGLIAVIMTLTGAMLTSMVVAREWERGTMEALMMTPIRVWEMTLGKLLPYFMLGMGGMLMSVAMALWLFEVPLRGSFPVLVAASALYMLVALAMGLLISTVARSQFVAGQIALVADVPRTATVRSAGDLIALEITRDVFDQLLRANKPLAVRFQEQIAVTGIRLRPCSAAT